MLALPRVVAQIGHPWLDLLSLREDQLEVLRLHSVCQVDVGTYLSLVPLVPNEQDRGQTPIPETLLTLGKRLKERVT